MERVEQQRQSQGDAKRRERPSVDTEPSLERTADGVAGRWGGESIGRHSETAAVGTHPTARRDVGWRVNPFSTSPFRRR